MASGRKRISKSLGGKKRLIAASKEHAPAPRWLDIKVFGLGKAMRRSIKRFRSKHWRRSKLKL
ncbi:MAG: 50S ribosomal protein L39e [Candidatus Nanohaloarchaeota archaeon]|nr:50S ribosomal protein L39e [Candidatus Nanohaloarchaeota archaeon]